MSHERLQTDFPRSHHIMIMPKFLQCICKIHLKILSLVTHSVPSVTSVHILVKQSATIHSVYDFMIQRTIQQR